MRIAILTNAFPPDAKGGAGRIAALQSEMLTAAGHNVRVWHPEIRWFGASVPVRLFHHLSDLRPRKELTNEIIAWKPDVLLTHNLTGCGFGTPRTVQLTGVRWIHVLHDVQLFEPSGQLVNADNISLWQRLWSTLRRRSLGIPEVVASPTAWLLHEHQRRGFFKTSQTAVLPNPAPAVMQTERRLHDPVRLLFVGRLSDDKGSNILAGLAHELAIPFELTVVGDGPEAEDLQTLGSNVHVLGALGSDQVLGRMREADILLVPSQIQENQPTVILEAASVGLPVVASDVGGIKETLDEAGAVCPTDDLEVWKRAIIRLTQNQHDYENECRRMYGLAVNHKADQYLARLISVLSR